MKPKIVILSAFASPLRSGAEACAEEVPAALRNQYNFTIVTARMRRNLLKYDQLQGVPVIRIGFGCTFDKWLFPFLAPFVVRKLQPDVIHAVLETFAGLALHFCRFVYPKGKRLLTLQTTNAKLFKATLIRSADAVTAISSALVLIAKQSRGTVTRIPNGMHLQDMPQTEKISGRILFAGRLEKMKGIDVLLRAFAMCNAQHATLYIAGDGSERKNLESLAESLDIADRVCFVGFVPVPAIYTEFAEAEIFCGFSRSEALGNVFIEAQAAGCAVIGTTVGGIPDTVSHNQTGLLVPPDNVEAAAKAIDAILNDKNLQSTLAENGKKNAQQYDWSSIAQQYKNVYESLLAEPIS